MSGFTALEADGALSLDDLVPNQPVNATEEPPPPPPAPPANVNVDGPTGINR